MSEIKINSTNGTATVSSLQIARDFDKQHYNVIRDIENIKAQFCALTQRAEFSAVKFPPTEKYFIDSTYKAGTGKNYKSYKVTRDGFMLLSMGFTGEKALALKIAYIEQFNAMEKELKKQEKLPYNNNGFITCENVFINNSIINGFPLKKEAFSTSYERGNNPMNENKDEIKRHLLDYVNEITRKSSGKNQYICPICGSGTGHNHTGAFTFYPENDTYYCFSCQASGDIFTLYGAMNNISDFKTIKTELEKKYCPVKKKDYTKFFQAAEQHLHETDYLTKRGISPETQRKFHCGYVSDFMYKNNQMTPAVIIPTSNSSFAWRSTTENLKQKRGKANILNISALNQPYCFVVEGEIDCMSIDECGFPCIGLGSVSNIGKIFNYNISKTVLIIAMDNDNAGRKAAKKLSALCEEHEIPFVMAQNDVYGDFKDANDLLLHDRETLVKTLAGLSERAENLDIEKWKSDLHKTQPIKKISDNKQTAKNKKIPLEDYEQFEKYIDEMEYSVRYNQITHNFEFYGFDKGESTEHLAENVPSIIQDKLVKNFTRVTKQKVIDYITRYATRHRFNPVLDMIQSVKWDGIDRINKIYEIFRIPADTEEGTYSRIFIYKWLLQCVCGLFNTIENPFSLDIVLVFIGRQGIGKTRFFEKLALKSAFFGEGICIDPRDKDSIIQATSKWISELGEIGSTMKKDMDSVKAFITKSTDEYRTPYGRASLHYPRITSFVGTVNDNEYLIDQTGNRRFVTVPLSPDLIIDYETQIKPFDALQLWAQVYWLVTEAEKEGKTKANCFRLTESEKKYLEKRNSAFTKPMKGENEVLDILEEQQTPQQGYICTSKEMTVLQFIQMHNLRYDANVVGKVLRKYGYEPKRKRMNGTIERVIRLPYKKYESVNSN